MRITVNGTEHDVPGGAVTGHEITYEQIVALAGKPSAKGMTVVYFWRGQGDIERKGTIYPGKTVHGVEGMHFDAVFTGNA